MKNESATVDKVHRLLKEREKVASCVAQAYTSAATYLSALSIDNMFEVLYNCTCKQPVIDAVSLLSTVTWASVFATAHIQTEIFSQVSTAYTERRSLNSPFVLTL